ncbi:MAG: TonB-dependent receptor [Alphaproteobacteria bacterium]|nr:TonB-dependent receptor [Alphaproteobacteria bacterium]
MTFSVRALLWSVSVLPITLVTAPAAKADTTAMEEIVVTGSHVRRSGTEGRIPIDVLDRDQFEKDGATRIIDTLKFLPANTGSFLTQEAGSLTGTAQFNIRGLGVGSTLTLINGRRGGQAPMADGNGNQFFDLNQLPFSMIARVDVQKDGASATYGSDAVGGVVNIITRKGFDGLELTAKAEAASNEAYSFGLAAGRKLDRGAVALYAGYYRQTRNIRTDFDFINERIGGDGDPTKSQLTSGTGAPGTYQQAVLDADGNYAGVSGNRFADPNCEAAGGILQSGLCRHDFADQLSVIPAEERIQLFAEADYDISDQLEVFAELSFSHNAVNATIGPQLFRNGLADGNILIPADHPFNFFVDDGEGGITYVAPEDWDNSIHTAVPLNCSCRPLGIEFNGYNSEFDREIRLDYVRAVAGTEYDFADSWHATASIMYAHAVRDQSEGYNYKKAELNAAVADGSFNPFGTRTANPDLVSPKDGISVAGLDRDVLLNFMHFRENHSVSSQVVSELVVGGDLWQLPGGPVGVAVGGQHRWDSLRLEEDPLWAAGLSRVPETADLVIEGSEDVIATFAEVLLPLADSFELTAAIRHESYGGSIGATTDPKVTARWQATDSLAFRASYGTSFQAPTVSQTGNSSGSAFLNDPASMNADGDIVCESTGLASLITVNVQGGDNLKPQTASNLNGGVAYRQGGFELSLDYWRFDYQNLVRPDGEAQAIVNNDCLDGVADDPRVVRSSSGQIRSVTLSFINTGDVVTDGLDMALAYSFPETSVGSVRLSAAASYVNRFDITSVADDVVTVTKGAGNRNFANPFSSVPRWRANMRLNWISGKHGVNAAVRYISGYKNDQLTPAGDIESWTSVDVGYNYDFANLFGKSASIRVGVNNLFDRIPPALGPNQRPGYDANVHEIRGRLAYVALKAAF